MFRALAVPENVVRIVPVYTIDDTHWRWIWLSHFLYYSVQIRNADRKVIMSLRNTRPLLACVVFMQWTYEFSEPISK